MNRLLDIPEIVALDARGPTIRVPPDLDVPLTPRVRHIVDTAEYRRLAHISQLGLVSLVYPGATHSRFEHSLGVYRLALLYLRRLAHDERFAETIDRHDGESLIAAALLHDLGHWPYCHAVEDIRLTGVPPHEMFANSFLLEGEVADSLRDDWGINPREVVALLSDKPRDTKHRLLTSILSGPIDIDKMDYLSRDSLHCGVPYGRHFDRERLIASLCLNESGEGLAITEKGKTAAELMVFARYVMFSEVYWHHTVRSATAMFQRAFSLLQPVLDLDQVFRMTESPMIAEMLQISEGGPAHELLSGIFGARRNIYKRLAQFSVLQSPEVHEQLARRPYAWLTACGEELARRLSTALGSRVAPHEVLIDAPPIEREVQFDVSVHFRKEQRYLPLDEVSPVVRTLAKEQFDDYVKRVRIFGHARIADDVRRLANLTELVTEAVKQMEG